MTMEGKNNRLEVTEENIEEILEDSWQVGMFEDFIPEKIAKIYAFEDFADVHVKGTLVIYTPWVDGGVERVKAEMVLRIARDEKCLVHISHMFRDGKLGEIIAVDEEE